MIYLRCDDQDDPHSSIRIEIKGNGEVVGHEAYALLDHISEIDEKLFNNLMRAVVCNHGDVLLKFGNYSHYDDK